MYVHNVWKCESVDNILVESVARWRVKFIEILITWK